MVFVKNTSCLNKNIQIFVNVPAKTLGFEVKYTTYCAKKGVKTKTEI